MVFFLLSSSLACQQTEEKEGEVSSSSSSPERPFITVDWAFMTPRWKPSDFSYSAALDRCDDPSGRETAQHPSYFSRFFFISPEPETDYTFVPVRGSSAHLMRDYARHPARAGTIQPVYMHAFFTSRCNRPVSNKNRRKESVFRVWSPSTAVYSKFLR